MAEATWTTVAKGGVTISDRALREALRHGISPALRPSVWMLRSGAADASICGLYLELLESGCTRRAADEAQIELDLSRSGLQEEHERAALRRVLRAYAAYRPDVGYVQGQNFIAAGLMRVLSEE